MPGEIQAPVYPSNVVPTVQIPYEDGYTPKSVDSDYTLEPVNSISNTIEGGNILFCKKDIERAISKSVMFNTAKHIENGENVIYFMNGLVSNTIVYGNSLYFQTNAVMPYAEDAYRQDRSLCGIQRMDLNTAVVEKVTEDAASCFYIYDNQIFYQLSSTSYKQGEVNSITKIIASNLDGSNKKIIFETLEPVETLFSIYSNTIYISTSNLTLITYNISSREEREYELPVEHEYLDRIIPTEYGVLLQGVTSTEDESFVYLFSTVTEEIELLSDGWCRHLVYADDKALFINTLDGETVLEEYSLGTKSKKTIIRLDDTIQYIPDNIGVYGTEVYFFSGAGRAQDIESGQKVFMVNLLTDEWERLL